METNISKINILDYGNKITKDIGGITVPLTEENKKDFIKEVKKYTEKVLKEEAERFNDDGPYNEITAIHPKDEESKKILLQALKDAKKENERNIEKKQKN